jgi:hypothetical protein
MPVRISRLAAVAAALALVGLAGCEINNPVPAPVAVTPTTPPVVVQTPPTNPTVVVPPQ